MFRQENKEYLDRFSTTRGNESFRTWFVAEIPGHCRVYADFLRAYWLSHTICTRHRPFTGWSGSGRFRPPCNSLLDKTNKTMAKELSSDIKSFQGDTMPNKGLKAYLKSLTEDTSITRKNV